MGGELRPSGSCRSMAKAAVLGLLVGLAGGAAWGEAVKQDGFRALPRPVRYATPLAPPGGVKAVIVYGKTAPWTQAAALRVQQAIKRWCGQQLSLIDDRTATSEETWLLTDAYRRRPMIVLGNGEVNRVMHALATRYLLESNGSWPGGNRYVIRTIFEPFMADVNWTWRWRHRARRAWPPRRRSSPHCSRGSRRAQRP